MLRCSDEIFASQKKRENKPISSVLDTLGDGKVDSKA